MILDRVEAWHKIAEWLDRKESSHCQAGTRVMLAGAGGAQLVLWDLSRTRRTLPPPTEVHRVAYYDIVTSLNCFTDGSLSSFLSSFCFSWISNLKRYIFIWTQSKCWGGFWWKRQPCLRFMLCHIWTLSSLLSHLIQPGTNKTFYTYKYCGALPSSISNLVKGLVQKRPAVKSFPWVPLAVVSASLLQFPVWPGPDQSRRQTGTSTILFGRLCGHDSRILSCANYICVVGKYGTPPSLLWIFVKVSYWLDFIPTHPTPMSCIPLLQSNV